MATKYGNRVKESTDTTGTGTLDLSGAPTGFRSFGDEFTSGDAEISYLIVDDPENPTDYEYGKGTYTAGTPDTLARNTVEGSSNAGNKVSLAAGTKTVIATPLASDLLDATGIITTRGDLIRGAAGGAAQRVALGTAGQVVGSDGTDAEWKWHGIVQQVHTQTGAVATGTTILPSDDTIPQSTEGNEYMTLAITPKSATNALLIEVVLQASFSTAGSIGVALFQDSTAGALATGRSFVGTGNGGFCTVFRHRMTAGTAIETTFKVRAGGSVAGTLTFNGTSGGRLHGGVMASSITITEVAA